MERPMSPWVRRARERTLPISVAGGSDIAADERTPGVVPIMATGRRWAPSAVDGEAVPIELRVDPVCSCGEVHRGWQHREAAER